MVVLRCTIKMSAFLTPSDETRLKRKVMELILLVLYCKRARRFPLRRLGFRLTNDKCIWLSAPARLLSSDFECHVPKAKGWTQAFFFAASFDVFLPVAKIPFSSAVSEIFTVGKMGFLAVVFFIVGALILREDDKAVAYEPFHMRLEAQIIRFENPQGIDYQGEPCGGQFTPRQCNTIVSAFIDAYVRWSTLTIFLVLGVL